MGDFFSLHIGRSALLTQRQALDVTGHNIANANTEGYTRQSVQSVAIPGPTVSSRFARVDNIGAGVQSLGVKRLNDRFLDMRSYQEHAAQSGLSQSQSTLTTIELAFGEPSDQGLGANINDLFAAWDDVAAHPDDLSARAQLTEKAKGVAAHFKQLDSSMETQRNDAVVQLQAVVNDVNDLAQGVAQLNEAIRAAVVGGLSPNDLLDQRDQMISSLAEKVGVTVREGDNGSVDIYVSGSSLVHGSTAESFGLNVTPGGSGTATVVWSRTGLTAGVAGEAGGLQATINDVVPRYRAGLRAVAQTLADETNALHTTGFDMNGAAGVPFFVMDPDGIKLNPAIATDPRLVAASSSNTTSRDGTIAAGIAALSGTDAAYRDLVARLGIESKAVTQRMTVQVNVTKEADRAREAQGGVNIDEEMVSLVSIQHAYEAAARFITSVDEMLDTLINRTGTVGR